MFERFTNPARHVVVLAQEEARQLQHNYIGTEHVFLGLLGEPRGIACQALERFGITRDGAREEVKAMIGLGKHQPTGHIPFTPRAKKSLELALREALQLHHGYIGTEHILLGLIKEEKGVAGQIMRKHSPDLTPIRMTVLDLVAATPTGPVPAAGPHWLRRGSAVLPGETIERGEPELRTTQAADSSLTEAARLAGPQRVGSHHLLLAALGDPDTAAARTLAALGVDLKQAREALRTADVAGTSDEQPEEAGRRQMVIRVTDEQVTIEARDPLIVSAGRAAVDALGRNDAPPGTIRGDLPASASLTAVWQALHDSLVAMHRRATLPAEAAGSAGTAADADQPGDQDGPVNLPPGNEAA